MKGLFRANPAFSFAAALLVVLLVVCFPTVRTLHEKWILFDQGFSHGYILFFIALYFFWKDRAELSRRVSPPRSPLRFLPLIVSSLLWAIAYYFDVLILQFLLLPIVLFSMFFAVFGTSFSRYSFKSLGLIYFALPVWDALVPLLQKMTVAVCEFVVGFVIPIHISEFTIETTDGSFVVESGCSGSNYLLVMLMLASIYVREFSLARRDVVILFCTATVSALVANWVRVSSLVMIGHLTQMKSPLVYHHGNFGWIIFACVLVLLGAILPRFFSKAATGPAMVVKKDEPGVATVSAQLLVRNLLATVLVVVTAPWLIKAYLDGVEHFRVKPVPMKLGQSSQLNGWTIGPLGKNAVAVHYENADETVARTLSKGLSSYGVQAYRYYSQLREHGLIDYRNTLFNPNEVAIVDTRYLSDLGITQVRLRFSQFHQEQVVWYWFEIDGRRTASRMKAKLYSILSQLSPFSDGVSALVVVSAAPDFRNKTRELEFDQDVLEVLRQ